MTSIPIPLPKFQIKLKKNHLINNSIQLSKFNIKLKNVQQTINESRRPLSEQFPIKSKPVVSKKYDEMIAPEKGDIIVEVVHAWISSFDIVTESANISAISKNIYDIVVKIKGENHFRGVQVKTLMHLRMIYGVLIQEIVNIQKIY